MARNRTDLLPITWHQLNVSAFNRVWIKLGFGVQARARRSTQGFDLRIRYGTNDTIQKSRVEVREVPWRAGKQLRPTLVCSVCSRPTTKTLYLGSDFRFSCAKCLGVPSWKIRMPMTWDLGDEVRFRRLLKRKLDQDILQFELAALRTLSPADFFASRPYLVPPWIDHVRALDPMLHQKLLKLMHGKYRSVMMRRRVVMLNEREHEWLMDELLKVFTKSTKITKKEITWLRNHQPQLKSSCPKIPTSSTQDSTGQTLKLENQSLSESLGDQPGSTLMESSSRPSETASSSSRTSSGRDMTVASALEEALLDAINATVRGTTREADETSSVPSASEEES